MFARFIATLGWLEAAIGHGLASFCKLAAAFAEHLAGVLGRLSERLRALPALARMRLGMALIAGFLAMVAWQTRDPIVNWFEDINGMRPLLAAKSWHYHLQELGAEKLHAIEADVFVIDYAKEGGLVPFTKAEIERIKLGKSGKRRQIVSYLSVGEGEEYRWYWKPEWSKSDAKMPAWHVERNCAWPDNHAIRFWHPEWKDIMYRGAESYLKRIIDAGFDGVYLDRVDIYDQFPDGKHGAPADVEGAMVDFVIELARAARRLKPDFLIIPQNGEPLLAHKRYRRVIDGLGKEDLLHGHTGTGERNPVTDIKWSVDHLKVLLADRKPVIAVEYLVTKEAVATATLELRQLGLVPTFQDRSLDGSDPTMPRIDLAPTKGTPEWTKTMCSDKKAW